MADKEAIEGDGDGTKSPSDVSKIIHQFDQLKSFIISSEDYNLTFRQEILERTNSLQLQVFTTLQKFGQLIAKADELTQRQTMIVGDQEHLSEQLMPNAASAFNGIAIRDIVSGVILLIVSLIYLAAWGIQVFSRQQETKDFARDTIKTITDFYFGLITKNWGEFQILEIFKAAGCASLIRRASTSTAWTSPGRNLFSPPTQGEGPPRKLRRKDRSSAARRSP